MTNKSKLQFYLLTSTKNLTTFVKFLHEKKLVNEITAVTLKHNDIGARLVEKGSGFIEKIIRLLFFF